jgi:hypothetical protein
MMESQSNDDRQYYPSDPHLAIKSHASLLVGANVLCAVVSYSQLFRFICLEEKYSFEQENFSAK